MRFGFFDANITGTDQNGMPIFDRAEDAEFFSKFMASMLKDGIYPSPTNGFEVTVDSGMTLAVAAGCCCIQGRFGWQEQSETVEVAAADASAVRYDRVVIRLDFANREIRLQVRAGTPGSGSAPSVVRNTNYWDLSLATVKVNAGATSITSGNITDTRASSDLCGYVYSLGTVSTGFRTLTVQPGSWQGSAAPYSATIGNLGQVTITESSRVIVTPHVADDTVSMPTCMECGVYCSGQGYKSLSFRAQYDKPSVAVTFDIMVLDYA